MNFLRLTWHCAKKGIQVGCVLGTAVVAPLTIYRGFRAGKSIDFSRLVLNQTYSILFGTAISLGMMMGKYYGWENKARSLQDRAYRIEVSKNQNRVDLFTEIAFAGSFLGTFLITRRFFFSIGATSPFVVAGLLFYLMSKPKE